jgi:hypothetical protein
MSEKKVNVLTYYVGAKNWLKHNKGDVNERMMR